MPIEENKIVILGFSLPSESVTLVAAMDKLHW